MKKIKCFGLEVSIKMIKTNPSENIVALFDPTKKQIILNENSESLFQDFSHEIFHLFWFRTGMAQSKIDDSIEEIMCENFSVFLSENIEYLYRFYEKTRKNSLTKRK